MRDSYIKSKMKLAEAKAKNKQGLRNSDQIMGSGIINRDGVPRLPPEQRIVTNWPVLDLGVHPEIAINNWQLEVIGLCENPLILNFEKLKSLPMTQDISDFHCVTGWSQFDLSWKGVRFSDLAKISKVLPEAKFVYITAYDNYSTNLPLEEAMKCDVLIAYEVNNTPLPIEHGGPVRMITPQLWAWKGAKWIRSIEFLAQDKKGFWEDRGYSNSAIPWLNDRYTTDEPKD